MMPSCYTSILFSLSDRIRRVINRIVSHWLSASSLAAGTREQPEGSASRASSRCASLLKNVRVGVQA